MRANGTSPRQLAEKAAAEERELLRRAGLAIHQRYLRGEITALEERQLYDDLRKEPDNLTRLAAS